MPISILDWSLFCSCLENETPLSLRDNLPPSWRESERIRRLKTKRDMAKKISSNLSKE